MKNFIAFALVFVMFSACKKDDGTIELNYDGRNITAPILPAQLYESAVMFPSNFSGNDAENQLIEVEFYVLEEPNSIEVFIYTGGINAPQEQIYSKSVLSEISSNSWNTHVLETPITLSGADNLWVSIRYLQFEQLATVGCDAGPAEENGDWLFDGNDGEWIPLSQRSRTNINWNIRAKVRLPQE